MAMVVVPELRVLDVVRQTGWLGVVARDNVEIEPAVEMAGYTRVDMTELPTSLMALAANPILLAYRHDDPDAALALDVRKLVDVPVRPATIDAAAFTTLVTTEGARMTRAVYSVRNNVRQYLRVQLGEDAKVSSASVGGNLVKPARDGETGTVLLPLLQSAMHGRELGAFPVEVVYTEPSLNLPARKGTVALALPAVDLPVARASWEVWLPESHVAYDARGDVSAASSAGLVDGAMRAQRTPSGTRELTIRRLREGIERFLITDINNPAGSVGGGEKYTGSPIQEPEGGAAVAGILPVEVELPLEGRPYMFCRTLIDEGAPLTLRMSLYGEDSASRLLSVQRALALVAGCVAGWALRKRGTRDRTLAVVAAAAALGAYAYGYPLGLTAWRSGIFWCALGVVVVLGSAAIQTLWRRYGASPLPHRVTE